MKLITPETFKRVHKNSGAFVSFAARSGVVSLSVALMAILKVKATDKVAFALDGKKVFILKSDKGFQLRETKNSVSSFNSVNFVRGIFDHIGYKGNSIRIYVDQEPVIRDGIKYHELGTVVALRKMESKAEQKGMTAPKRF